MKYIKQFVAWINSRREAVQRANDQHISKEINDRVQLREFRGEIYISLDEIPIVSLSSHTKEAIQALEDSRRAFREYINQSSK